MEKEKKKPVEKRDVSYLVRSYNLKGHVLNKAASREDEWGETVATRVNSVLCLIAAEARYHVRCYTKFCGRVPTGQKRGRPQDENIASALEKLCDFINDSDECQFSLHELMRRMEEELPDESTITEKTLRSKLQEEYGDAVVFHGISKRGILVCFRGFRFSSQIIDSWHTERANKEEDERLRIVEAAAAIIREDIRSTPYNITDYPRLSTFTERAADDIPETLRVFLDGAIAKSKTGKTERIVNKCISIAHSIIAATRPRSFVSSVLLGLGVFLFRKVASKNIVQAVSNLGFCSTYKDVTLFESSAAKSWKPDVKGGSFTQFVFDNADFNIQTLTGKGTFHSMGGIKCITPHTAVNDHEVTKCTTVPAASEIANIGKVELQTFKKFSNTGLQEITLRNVYSKAAFKEVAKPSNQDFLWMCGIFLQIPSIPAWQGFMDILTCTRPYVKSQVVALPFVNNPPTEYDTVFTVLKYAVEENKNTRQTSCVVTFGQPLYMKAKDIVASEASNPTVLSKVIVRLGGFHLLMSYLGGIGYIMGGSGLSELWSTIYASASVPHMLARHAYARAIRAHFLTYTALSKMILQEMDTGDANKEHVQRILTDFKTTPPTFDNVQNDLTIEKCLVLLKVLNIKQNM